MVEPSSIFLCYCSKDRDFCQRLARDLDDRGIKVWWDQTSVQVGDILPENLRSGIEGSFWFGIVLSPDALTSLWVSRELDIALAREPSGSPPRRILPILLKDSPVPHSIHDLAHADFRYSYSEGLKGLISRIGAPIEAEIENLLLSEDAQKIRSAWSRIKNEEHQRCRERLLRKLHSESPSERAAALMALWTLRDRDALPEIQRLFQDPSAAVLIRALTFAGESLSRSFVPPITNLLVHRDPNVRQAARQAYYRITGKRP